MISQIHNVLDPNFVDIKHNFFLNTYRHKEDQKQSQKRQKLYTFKDRLNCARQVAKQFSSVAASTLSNKDGQNKISQTTVHSNSRILLKKFCNNMVTPTHRKNQFLRNNIQKKENSSSHKQKNTNSKREPFYLSHQLNLPDSYNYSSQIFFSLAATANVHSPLNYDCQQSAFIKPSNKKNVLLAQKYKKQFKNYIENQVVIQQLLQKNIHNFQHTTQVKSEYSSAFKSKILRFSVLKKQQPKQKIKCSSEITNKENILLKPNFRKQSLKINYQKVNRELGPGTYNKDLSFIGDKGIRFNQTATRFKQKQLHPTPSPCYYEVKQNQFQQYCSPHRHQNRYYAKNKLSSVESQQIFSSPLMKVPSLKRTINQRSYNKTPRQHDHSSYFNFNNLKKAFQKIVPIEEKNRQIIVKNQNKLFKVVKGITLKSQKQLSSQQNLILF